MHPNKKQLTKQWFQSSEKRVGSQQKYEGTQESWLEGPGVVVGSAPAGPVPMEFGVHND